ncbi:MAG: class IV adenylate cyclase [Candidatus Thorarchaeota archaeon]
MDESIFEVEVKVPISDIDFIETGLERLGAIKTNTETQVDIYMNHPCKSFEDTDEALRLRRRVNISLEDQDEIDITHPLLEMTYKGPKIDTTTKTRVELSLGIDDISIAKELLINLGFKEVGVITKKRIFYHINEIVVSIDEVESVGFFLELERVVYSMDAIPEARKDIFHLLEELGIDPASSIRTSYLEILLEKK